MVPPAVVTRTLAVPAVPAGVVQLRLVSLITLKLVHALPPMVTSVAAQYSLPKSLPVMVISFPPKVLPELGETAVTVGSRAQKNNVSGILLTLVTPSLVTWTLAEPTPRAGVMQVMLVSLTTLKLVQGKFPPNVTAVAPVNLVPVMVIEVPPVMGPAFGDTEVTMGGVT